jgi:hypothetical protein
LSPPNVQFPCTFAPERKVPIPPHASHLPVDLSCCFPLPVLTFHPTWAPPSSPPQRLSRTVSQTDRHMHWPAYRAQAAVAQGRCLL